jgi:hypothetical protein
MPYEKGSYLASPCITVPETNRSNLFAEKFGA